MSQASGFDRLARPYRFLERLTFGRALERCRTAQLPRMLAARHALVLGDGDGRFTAALLAANPRVRVVAVDSSSAMLALLAARAQRLGASSRLTIHTADALEFLKRLPVQTPEHPPAHAAERLHKDRENSTDSPHTDPRRGCFDLLTTHFFLDCLTIEQVGSLAHAVTRILAPGAVWVVSEFATPTLWARLVVAALYLAFRLLTGLRVQRLPPFRTLLAEAGFTPLAEQTSLQGLLISTAWTLSSSSTLAAGQNGATPAEATTPNPPTLPPA